MNTRLALTGLGSLLALGGCPLGQPLYEAESQVLVTTDLGTFTIQLDRAAAPVTVANFERYVEEGFYDGTLIHRVVRGAFFQAGGFLPGLEEKPPTHEPIVNEGRNGLRNVRGAIAMARGAEADSAQAEFFINASDNPAFDATLDFPGYAVFGRVVDGLDVVDAIVAVETTTADGFRDLPAEEIVIRSATLEPGPPVLTPAWDAYFSGVQFNAAVLLRQVLVQGLSFLIPGGD